jgi:hypothetical protein
MTTRRREFLKHSGLVLGLSSGLAWKGRAAEERPNFLIILTDDQRADTFTPDFMPNTSALFEAGVRFERGFVTTPLCAPCRSSLLTGKLGRNTGVLDNMTLLQETIFPERLSDSGYFTGLVGKFLNPWNGSLPAWNFPVALKLLFCASSKAREPRPPAAGERLRLRIRRCSSNALSAGQRCH